MTTKTKKPVKSIQKFDYTTIKSFEDACEKLGLDPANIPDVKDIQDEFKKSIISVYKLMIVYKAINNGWIPDWSDNNQWKYYPWYEVLSSGFGFSGANCDYDRALASVGSRLCTDTREKALYVAAQFKAEYQDYFLYSK